MQPDEKELLLSRIENGSPHDVNHIRLCVTLAESEPDDLIRAFAKSWLQVNAIHFAKQLII